MSSESLIPRIDCRQSDASGLFRQLRQKLSPRGDVVSESGRQRTLELFGEALSPREVVRRICEDVRRDGLGSVLDYTLKLDRVQLTAETMRVSWAEFRAAVQAADPALLQVVRRIRENVAEFQRAVLPADARVERSLGGGRVILRQRHLPMRRVGICVPGGAAAYPSTVLIKLSSSASTFFNAGAF